MSERDKRYVFIVNDGPYGSERPYNALRLAMQLAKRSVAQVRLFLVGDGVQCAVQGQATPKGYYNIERMVKFVTGRGAVAT